MQTQYPSFQQQQFLQYSSPFALHNIQNHPILGGFNAMHNKNNNNRYNRPYQSHNKKQSTNSYSKKPVISDTKSYQKLENNIDLVDRLSNTVEDIPKNNLNDIKSKSPRNPPQVESHTKIESPIKYLPENILSSSDSYELQKNSNSSEPLLESQKDNLPRPPLGSIDVQTYFNMISPHAVEQRNIADITVANNHDISTKINELQISISNASEIVSGESEGAQNNTSMGNCERFFTSGIIDQSDLNIQNEKTSENENDELEALPRLCDTDPIFQVDIPKNVSKIGNNILPSVIPVEIQKDSEFAIFIAEV